MIVEHSTDILKSNAPTQVVPVNALGVPGAGLAKQYAVAFPESNRHYKRWCQGGQASPGKLLCVRTAPTTPVLVYFCTKGNWRDPSRLEWVIEGLTSLHRYAQAKRLEAPIALPALGCGLGGLSWKSVRKEIYDILEAAPYRVDLYLPR